MMELITRTCHRQELRQVASWCSGEGLAPGSPREAQLCLMWRALQHTRSRLSSVTGDLEAHRSQHLTEMAEVRKSLEQIRIFTEHKDVLAQDIQDDNDRLMEQLRRLVSLQDAQISEVAKMLYQQGLTELVHSSPSEQVAYLLVERASLLETSDGNTAGLMGTEAQSLNTSARQSTHKGAPRHGQGSWKRLFGLHKASQSKTTFIPEEARHSAGQEGTLVRECSRLERDLEEGSRRLAMAHNEIRRLTDELESAHLTQRAYEPELQSAEQEVEQLRQEVEKLKKYEIVELRKAKELNDGLDLEIRALRNRVRSLDAEKSSVQQTVVSLQEKAERLESALQQQQQQQQLLTLQVQANESAKAQTADQAQNHHTCRNVQDKLTAQTRHFLEKEETKEVERLESSPQEEQQQQQLVTVQLQVDRANELAEILSLQQQLGNSHNNNLISKICTKQNNLHDQKLWQQKEADSRAWENTHSQLEDCFRTEDKELHTQLCNENTTHGECPDYQEVMKITQDECETLKKEICETLQCLDKERSKYHEMKEKHKAKLCRAKQKLDDETTWRDEKIKSLERKLSLCSHSLTKEKELVISITVENEKLLFERRRLLQQLNEEEHNKNDSNLAASLSKFRVDFLEMENKKLGNKMFHMSNQLSVLERSLQNMQSLHLAEELQKMSNHQQGFTSLSVKSAMCPDLSEVKALLDTTHSKQTDKPPSPLYCISGPLCRSAEMGYLNLTSMQSHPDRSGPSTALSNSESMKS
ncbi:coiled-coil domain-containing protein 30 isoform X2 [Brachyistius frenatus]|uniref:coiled-coil domain-containing protein 30 isoform X2 n=1 Tax=Brachyistius frenatus TaxID=100188 RepID=UPI0037E97DFD